MCCLEPEEQQKGLETEDDMVEDRRMWTDRGRSSRNEETYLTTREPPVLAC
jgi:hypothetical protein